MAAIGTHISDSIQASRGASFDFFVGRRVEEMVIAIKARDGQSDSALTATDGQLQIFGLALLCTSAAAVGLWQLAGRRLSTITSEKNGHGAKVMSIGYILYPPPAYRHVMLVFNDRYRMSVWHGLGNECLGLKLADFDGVR